MSTVDELEAAAQADVDSGAVPACQLAVAKDGRTLVSETFGDATDATRFCIFSATKPLVASAVWLLMGDGTLDVTRPVSTYIPEFAAHGKAAVTVEQVLLHTSGFPNAPMGDLEGADATRRRARFSEWFLEWEPGSRFDYHATSAHWVLVDLIERLSGTDGRDFIEQRVCAPLGLPRVLGIPRDAQGSIAPLVALTADAATDVGMRLNDPEVRAAGSPGGGAVMTAAQLAQLYQGFLHNPGELWEAAVLGDVTTNIRCRFDDPLMGVPVNRTLGLVLAGDDGNHVLRYAIFGEACSPGSFGHAGAHAQVGWADPETGISFAYLNNAVTTDMLRAGIRANRLATIAAALDL